MWDRVITARGLYVSDIKMLVDTRTQGVILLLLLGYIALNDAARCKYICQIKNTMLSQNYQILERVRLF